MVVYFKIPDIEFGDISRYSENQSQISLQKMGKIRHCRYKYHSSTPGSIVPDSTPKPYTYPQNSTLIDSYPNEEQGPVQIQNNIFRNIAIPPSVLKQELPHTSHTSSLRKKKKSLTIRESFPLSVDVKQMLIEQKKLPKKSRLTVAKVAAIRTMRKMEKDKEVIEKKEAVLGDWKSLKDALSETKALSETRGNKHIFGLMSARETSRRRRERMSEDMNIFNSALQDFEWK